MVLDYYNLDLILNIFSTFPFLPLHAKGTAASNIHSIFKDRNRMVCNACVKIKKITGFKTRKQINIVILDLLNITVFGVYIVKMFFLTQQFLQGNIHMNINKKCLRQK